ncbi:hypothetical protein BH10CHL1_BH10CHL1_17970 [soil metagenome]
MTNHHGAFLLYLPYFFTPLTLFFILIEWNQQTD